MRKTTRTLCLLLPTLILATMFSLLTGCSSGSPTPSITNSQTTASTTITPNATTSTTIPTTPTTSVIFDDPVPVPTYEGGVIAETIYDCGDGLAAGRDSKAQMVGVSETTRKQFDAYLDKLKKAGFSEIARNAEFGNLYVQYYRESSRQLVYAYFIESLQEARIIEDKASVPETAFEYTCADGDVTVYQYAIMQYFNDATEQYYNNGMFYIIRLADNRLVCIDGGNIDTQASTKATEELYRFMQEITGSETVNIACWFITHPHGDHYGFLAKFVQRQDKYPVNIERIMFNFPNPDLTDGIEPTHIGSLLSQKCPDILYIKPHTGQKITMGNMEIKVLFTHEDFVPVQTGESFVREGNNTTTMLQLHFNGKTMMLMGDWGGNGEAVNGEHSSYGWPRLQKMYISKNGDNSLKSDIVQVAHHALNAYFEEFYNTAGAKYAFFSAPDTSLDSSSWPARTVLSQVISAGSDPQRIYFANRYTYALHIARNGTITAAAEGIRGAYTTDQPYNAWFQKDYVNEILKVQEPYRVPTKEELENWSKIHS